MVNSYIDTNDGKRFLLIEENDVQWLLTCAKDMLAKDAELAKTINSPIISMIEDNISKIEQAQKKIENDNLSRYKEI